MFPKTQQQQQLQLKWDLEVCLFEFGLLFYVLFKKKLASKIFFFLKQQQQEKKGT